jgi:hypothetical protein
MNVIRTLGATFLLIGTVGAVLVSAAYNDNHFTYRRDGMILINGEVFFPLGVYFMPIPVQRDNDELLAKVESEGRGFLFSEFAADGGNFVMYPNFHYYVRDAYNKEWAFWDSYLPQDLTDIHESMPPAEDFDVKLDLDAASNAGIKLLGEHSLTTAWSRNPTDFPHYYYQDYQKGHDIAEWLGGVFSGPRVSGETLDYFNDVRTQMERSGAEDAFFGWAVAQEPAWIIWRCYRKKEVDYPTIEEVNDAYDLVRSLEDGSNANHPCFIEECKAAIVSDLYKSYHTGCDILGYNIRSFPEPADPEYTFINNPWASVHGDAADLHFWSVEGAKPVICCVDTVWKDDIFPSAHLLRFSTYDAIIHRVNGVVWGMWHFAYPLKGGSYQVPDDQTEEDLKPLIREVGRPRAQGGMKEVLEAPFDDAMIEAIVRFDGDVVERTAIVGGDLTPKNHICSGRYLIEGCVKDVEEETSGDGTAHFTYLIAACREGRNALTGEPENEYEVTFKPCFSGDWLAPSVEGLEPDGPTREIPVVNCTFTDTFVGEDVHIYRFQKPARFGEAP